MSFKKSVQDYFPYTLTTENANQALISDKDHLLLIGTQKDNRYICELIETGRISVGADAEGYSLACIDSPWHKGRRVVVIAGNDPSGVIYGVSEFNSHVLSTAIAPNEPAQYRNAFDKIQDFQIRERPMITNRGIWSWGYVIYDYKRFIDNMARLRLNMLTIWNDCPPANCREIIQYAHSRGVKIVLGFPYGWGNKEIDLANKQDQERVKIETLDDFHRNYLDLGMDGIYIQTLTERTDMEIGGKSIAGLACDWVNGLAELLYNECPNLYFQWGIHAPSILGNYREFERLDPRVVLVWEDAGVIPYSYNPVTTYNDNLPPHAKAAVLGSVESTAEYSIKLASSRGKMEFGMVAKGFIWLPWESEFEHHGPFILGERSSDFVRSRFELRKKRWEMVNALWARNYPAAASFYRRILDCNPSRMTVSALIEDGMFEESIQSSVALFANTLWNPRVDDIELQARAVASCR